MNVKHRDLLWNYLRPSPLLPGANRRAMRSRSLRTSFADYGGCADDLWAFSCRRLHDGACASCKRRGKGL